MNERVLVTAALPYANGSLHLGHLVEYCQADMYVRALKHLGTDAIYICANDAHGTPIELNAKRIGVAPEAMVASVHAEHQRDFGRFDVVFDHFSITHSDTNRAVVEEVYRTLRAKGQIEDREIDGTWCETDQRFLPDRFVKGICPRCGVADQYGDVCEACKATYTPTDLKEPRCALCGKQPIIKKSTHVFFKLSGSQHVEFLRKWIDSGALQPDVANYVRSWIEGGLKDWCISRDGPYFGFAIPDRPGKYFYVWLDAPLGYVATSMDWAKAKSLTFDELWRSPKTRIEHIIGKDIVYFHTLFWPAVLQAVGYTLPSKVHVHGMLTVNGEKMSKTRGTFIKAATFADNVEPQALRYYYASKYGGETDDLDLSFEDLIYKVNGELVNKHANLFSRVSQFLSSKLDNRVSDLPFTAAEAQAEPTGDGTPLDLARRVVKSGKRIEALYRERQFSQVVRELGAIADIGNEYMQSQKPWDQLKTDPETARATCTFVANVCQALAMYLWPIIPRFAEAGARILATKIDRMDHRQLFCERSRSIGTFERLFDRIDKKATDAMVEASKGSLGASKPDLAKAGPPVPPVKAEITFDQFKTMDFRVGVIKTAEVVPKSKKLLRLEVDLGEPTIRQVVAGIAEVYEPAQLIGTRVIVVANLKAAKIMGVDSRGMVLAANNGQALALLRPAADVPPGTPVS
jgi:methionyl-tRNA synthetase